MTDISADPGTSGRLVSGEAVELDVRVARLGSRVLAFLIDFLVLMAVAVVLFAVTGVVVQLIPRSLQDAALSAAIWTLFLVFVLAVIPIGVETLTKGRSLGKVVLGLRVVRDDGGPIRFRHSLVRGVSGFGVEFPGLLMPGVTWLAALGVMLIHPSGKRIGDLMAGTIVIHERTPTVRIWTPAMPMGLSGWSRIADLTNLDDELALAVRHFLARNHEITEPARTRLGTALEGELRAVIKPQPPPGTPGWAFLAAVLAERHRRSGSRMARNRTVTAQVWDTLYGPAQGQAWWAGAPVLTASPPATIPAPEPMAVSTTASAPPRAGDQRS